MPSYFKYLKPAATFFLWYIFNSASAFALPAVSQITSSGNPDSDTLDHEAAMPTVSELDYHTITQAKLSCRTQGSQSFMGSMKCEDAPGQPGMKSQIETQFKNSMNKFMTDYYSGQVVTDVTSASSPIWNIPTPVCNLSTGEGTANNPANFQGQQCPPFTHLTWTSHSWSYDGWPGDLSSNPNPPVDNSREYSWWRGLYVQIFFHFAGQVMHDFDQQGVVNITHLDQNGNVVTTASASDTVPAGPAARDALRLQIGRSTTISEIAQVEGGGNADAGYRSIASASSSCQGSGTTTQITSHACRFAVVNQSEIAQWGYLMMQEASVRTRVEINAKLSNQAQIMYNLQQSISSYCKGSSQYGPMPASEIPCIHCSGDPVFTASINKCYQDQLAHQFQQQLASTYTLDPLLPLPNVGGAP